LQLQADTQTTVTILCPAGLHVLDKKIKTKYKRRQNKKNVKNRKKRDKNKKVKKTFLHPW